MALKQRLTKEEHAKLPELLRGEYIADGEEFKLDVEGAEDVGALKRAKDRESEGRRNAETKLREIEDAAAEQKRLLDDATTDAARKAGDIKTLEASWARKHDETTAASNSRIEKLQTVMTGQLVDKVAMDIATRLSTTAPKLLLPHIKARIKADFEGDVPATKFLDAEGKPSELNAEGLYKEFLANKDFAPIITVSKTSGGASSNNGGGAANKQPQNNTQSADLSKMTPAELAASLKESKANSEQE